MQPPDSIPLKKRENMPEPKKRLPFFIYGFSKSLDPANAGVATFTRNVAILEAYFREHKVPVSNSGADQS